MTMGISVEDIRSVAAGETALREAIKKQSRVLETQITDLNQSKAMCERILAESNISYEKLRVEQYVAELLVDTAVLIGLLAWGILKINFSSKG